MKHTVLIISVLLFFNCSKNTSFKRSVSAYYNDSSIDRKIPFEKLDYINYSFAVIINGVVSFKTEEKLQKFKAFLKKAKGKQTKIILSIGGWGAKNFSDMALTKQSRQKFIQSCLVVLKKYNLQGIDLDWEYPVIQGEKGTKNRVKDKVNFTSLITEMHAAFQGKYQINFAAGAFDEYLMASVEWKKIEPYVDRINLMTYDLVNGNSTFSGNLAALYSTIQQKESTDNAILYLKELGINPHKIIIGIPFYGREFKGKENKNNGMYVKSTFVKAINYKELKEQYLTPNNAFTSYWDKKSSSSYLYNPKDTLFITYESQKSLKLKIEYLNKNDLGGVMFWRLMGDSNQFDLLETIHKNLK